MDDARFDVAVVGAGPAGLAAAAAAAEDGVGVAVVDENPREGGQIWRAGAVAGVRPEALELRRRAEQRGAQFLQGATVFDAPSPRELSLLTAEGVQSLTARRLILATGAVERFLPFPGWTLPGVCGAGGLQALAKSGLDLSGARVVVAGSGPLLLAVAAYLVEHGAHVLGLYEQAPRRAWTRLWPALAVRPRKLLQGAGLLATLARVPRRSGAWPLRAEAAGHGATRRLRRVVLSVGGREVAHEVDYLACGFGLVPATGLASLLGCALDGDRVRVDDLQGTSVPGVWCAGEPVGVGGLDCALAEGDVAGHAAAGREDLAGLARPRRNRERRFARALERAFALRDELRSLPTAETIVCRCEDVPWGALAGYDDARTAKLLTRCGMGPCQGRVCAAALEFLSGWSRDRVRPPLVPVPMEALGPAGAPAPSPKETSS